MDSQSVHLQIEELKGQLAHKQAQISDLQAQINSLYDSRSWKLSMPLRFFKRVIKFIYRCFVPKKLRTAIYIFRTSGISGVRSHLKNKYMSCFELWDIHDVKSMLDYCSGRGMTVLNGTELLAARQRGVESVLLISHELNLTGAPVAVQYFAEALQNMGKFPVIISPRDGALKEKLAQEKRCVVVQPEIYTSNFICHIAEFFSFVVVATIVGTPVINKLCGKETPVLWWIHEANVSYHKGVTDILPESLPFNVKVFCGGSHPESVLKSWRPNYEVNQLLYCVPDFSAVIKNQRGRKYAENDKMVFAIVGMQEERKAQDVLCDAILKLESAVRDKCKFYFIGRKHYPPIWEKINSLRNLFPHEVKYIEELPYDELVSFYSEMDCLVSTSKDDPMPIVVTDAMLLSKVIICADTCGSAQLLSENKAGLIFKGGDANQLADCITRVLREKNQLQPLCENARLVYEKNFTREVFEKKIENIYKQMVTPKMFSVDGKVSIVIPTYNGIGDIQKLLPALQEQTGLAGLEIIIVDSGSSDGTAEYAEKKGSMVMRITQEEFSHSYARNLGAEHASGKYLLFMTQDAFPSSKDWILRMAQPVLEGKAVAVSCREQPREDCDLWGRFNIWNHYTYLDAMYNDSVRGMPISRDANSLRKNAQLNDVDNFIVKEVFDKYKYRGNYAEDLDLGIRIINDGYKIAFLASVTVIHSHTRAPFYHFKRAIVDLQNLRKIIHDFPIQSLSQDDIISRIIVAYYFTSLLFLQRKLHVPANSFSEFIQLYEQDYAYVSSLFDGKNLEYMKNIVLEKPFESNITNMIYELEGFVKDGYWDKNLANDMRICLKRFVDYYQSSCIEYSPSVSDEIYEALLKMYGSFAGTLIGQYYVIHKDEDPNDVLCVFAQKYCSGV